MSREAPEHRLERLIDAATQAFLARGYRRTQISDIAKIMGVAPGTVYLYVQSKEALFDLVIRACLSDEGLSTIPVPVPTPAPGASLKLIRRTLERKGRIEALEESVRVSASERQFETVLRELFRKSERYWLAIKLVERSALDWPELAQAWFVRYRGKILGQLTRYFERAIESGILRRPPNVVAAARLVLEMNAALAIHRHLDPHPTPMDDRIAEETFVDAVLHAYGRATHKTQDQEVQS